MDDRYLTEATTEIDVDDDDKEITEDEDENN
jgi:hypothetical protein